MTLGIVGVSVWFGGLREWQKDVDKDRAEFHAHINNSQTTRNELQAEHNKNVRFKNYEP